MNLTTLYSKSELSQQVSDITQVNSTLETELATNDKQYRKDLKEHKLKIDGKNKEIRDIKSLMDQKVTELSEENKLCHQEVEKCQNIVKNNDLIAQHFYNQVKGTNKTLDKKFKLEFDLRKNEDRKLINIFKYVRLPQLKKIWITHPQNVDDQNSIKQFMVSLLDILYFLIPYSHIY